MELDSTFTVIFLALGIPILIVELYGVWRKPEGKGGGDTISEHWWWLRNKYPGLVIPMAVFLLWLFYHFVFERWKRT